MPDDQQQPVESFLDVPTDAVPEIKILPEGEYRLRLTKCSIEMSKNQNQMIVAVYEVPSEPTSEVMSTYTILPHNGQEDRQQIRSGNNLKDWKDAHGLDHTGKIDLAALANSGLELFAFVIVENYQGKPQNRLDRLIRKV